MCSYTRQRNGGQTSTNWRLLRSHARKWLSCVRTVADEERILYSVRCFPQFQQPRNNNYISMW